MKKLGKLFGKKPKSVEHDLHKHEYGLIQLTNDSSETKEEAMYDVDVIAIHGLNGDPLMTWTHSDGTLWLRDLLPDTLPGANIYTYCYRLSYS